MSTSISILVDGHARVVDGPCTLAELLVELQCAGDSVATALNGEFVARGLRAACLLSEGDSVTCIQLIVGG